MNRIAFFDEDTQFDFIYPKGKLYVKGSEKIVSKLKRLTQFAKRRSIPILGSVDNHTKNDPEFRSFPPHCVVGTSGQKKIKGTKLANVVFVPMKEKSSAVLRRLMRKHPQIILEKATLSAFDNPNMEKLIKEFDTFYVYGVALDYCVRKCCLGLRKYNKKVYLLTDATRSVDSKSAPRVLRELKAKGVHFIKTGQALKTI